jgi:hypothetical protein
MRLGLALASALVLAGCSTLSLNTNAPPAQRALDGLNDDIADAIIVFDLPRGIGPLAGASILSLDVGAPGSEKHIKAVLAPADADDAADGLSPPGSGRAYYFLAVGEKDGAAIRVAQLAARSAKGASVTAAVSVAPRFCAAGIVDPTQVTVSVLVTVPSVSRLAPLVDRQVLATLIGTEGLPPCT